MEKQKMNHLEKPADWSRETSGEGYPLLLYLEEDGKGVDWSQEKYPCFFWQVTVNHDTEHMDIAERMRELVKTYPIDETRIYCAGAGRAANMLWEMMGAYPDLFAAVAVSGGAGQTWKVRRASYVPAWIFGRENDSYCPAGGQVWSEQGKLLHGCLTLARSLRAAGNERVLYAQKPEMTGEELLEQKEVLDWMFFRSKREGYRIDMIRPGVYKLQDYTGSSFYVVEGSRAALVIDTGFGPEAITPWIRKITHLPLELALTHCHGDHMYHADEFETVYLSSGEKDVLEIMKKTMLAGRNINYDAIRDIPDGTMIDLGGCGIEVMTLAGHTPGSVVFIDHTHKVIFTGDAIGSGQMVLLQLQPCIPLAEYKKNLQRFYDRLEEMDDYVLLGGHLEQEGGYPFGTPYNPSPYNPLGKEVVQDMMELCDIFDSDKVKKEELPPDRLCEETSYLGFFGKAGLQARRSQF